MLQSGLAESVTTSSSPATEIYWHTGLDNWPGKNSGQTLILGAVRIAEDYFTCMGMSLAAGRNFTGNAAADSADIIINETTAERLHLKQPINQSVAWNGHSFRIVGVVKDALIQSSFKRPEPMMFLYDPGAANFMIYRLSASVKTQDAIVRLTALFSKYNPAYPYIYKFADDAYAAKFSLEVLIGKLAAVFAGLAIAVEGIRGARTDELCHSFAACALFFEYVVTEIRLSNYYRPRGVCACGGYCAADNIDRY